jgi:cyclase
MRRSIVLGVLLGVGVFSMAWAAGRQLPAAVGAQQVRTIEVEKVKDNLFVLRRGGGNTAVFVQATGVTVVDTKNPGWGQPLLAKIKELTDKPVITIINTHTHYDHVSGNVEFPAAVGVIAHENAAAGMKKMSPITGFSQPGAPPTPNIFDESNGRGLPRKTFRDRMTLGSGTDRIELYYFGRGHTNGDAWVLFPGLRVVHAGDIFEGKAVPILDANNGGSGVEIPDTLRKAHAELSKRADTIITGHSSQMAFADLLEYAEFNRDFLNAMRDAKKAGRSPEDTARAWSIPARYTGYATPRALTVQANVNTVFNEIK